MVAKQRGIAARAPRCAALSMYALISGCVPTPTRPPAEATAYDSQPHSRVGDLAPARAGAAAWPIDPERTAVTIIVRRAGPLARLGHDHVITSSAEAGTVWVGGTPAQSAFELRLQVDRLDVDLPQGRVAAGPEFATPLPDEARQGTRRNLLRAEVLDGATFPAITLRSIAATGEWAQAIVRVAVVLKDIEREQQVVVVVERDATGLVARGELRIDQSDFGITPFAVGGGAIQVADTLEIRFEIAAGPR